MLKGVAAQGGRFGAGRAVKREKRQRVEELRQRRVVRIQARLTSMQHIPSRRGIHNFIPGGRLGANRLKGQPAMKHEQGHNQTEKKDHMEGTRGISIMRGCASMIA